MVGHRITEAKTDVIAAAVGAAVGSLNTDRPSRARFGTGKLTADS